MFGTNRDHETQAQDFQDTKNRRQGRETPHLYLAAPFFSEAESEYNLDLKRTVEPFFRVFLPQESGCLMAEMIKQGIDVKDASERVYSTDVKAIMDCDVLLIVLNGRAIDEGAAFELGFAKASGKECFALQTDSRFAHAWGNNPMINAAVERTFRSVAELREWAKSWTVEKEERPST
jgi:nucleoside 2-deoxyribosyltransferase